jgi:hypothetical protein
MRVRGWGYARRFYSHALGVCRVRYPIPVVSPHSPRPAGKYRPGVSLLGVEWAQTSISDSVSPLVGVAKRHTTQKGFPQGRSSAGIQVVYLRQSR